MINNYILLNLHAKASNCGYLICEYITGLSATSMMGAYPLENVMVGNRVDPCLNISQSFKVQNQHQKKFKKWSGVNVKSQGGSVLFVNAV